MCSQVSVSHRSSMKAVWTVCQQRALSLRSSMENASTADVATLVLLNGFETAMAALTEANPMVLHEVDEDQKAFVLQIHEHCGAGLMDCRVLQQETCMLNASMLALCTSRTPSAVAVEAVKVTCTPSGKLPSCYAVLGHTWSR